jgi:hypothetical protein
MDTIMTFQKYHKGVNLSGLPIKLIPQFLPHEFNMLFIQYILLVQLI